MAKVEQQTRLPAEIDGKKNPLLRERYPDNWIHMIGLTVLGAYMRRYHHLNVQFSPDMPKKGPALFYTNHDSLLTTITLMVADPYYPQTIVPLKREFFNIPGVNNVLRAWGAIPVNRDGKDSEAFFRMLFLLKKGRTICIAGEGTRSPDGKLQPLDSSFIAFALICAKRGYPIVPLVEQGTFQALPKGAWFPKPYPIDLRSGERLDLSPWVRERATLEVRTEVAQYMQRQLAALLSPWQRPEPGTNPMWNREDYIKPKKK